ncbi:MAG: lysylphosphatidylglycerol synthase transmembrane domain-containing protein [Flammeovirgaceae bacterium]
MEKFKQIRKTVSYLFFWVLGFLLLYLAFRNQKLEDIWDTLLTADITWALLVFAISIFSHIIRVLRWRLLIQPLGYFPNAFQLYVGLLFGYLVSYAIPRLGEISRCVAVNRTENVPFSPMLGTVVTERLVDILCLFFMLLLAIVVEQELLYQFYREQLHADLSLLVTNHLEEIRTIGITIVLLGTLGLAFVINRWKMIKKLPPIRKVLAFVLKIVRGVTTIFRMENSLLFMLYTIAIWMSYFLMTYLWFFSFEESSHLGLKAGLVLLVIGSFGRSLPIQGGGFGAYHFVFTQGMMMYGITELYGGALAIMIHGLQTVYYLIVGGLATLYLMFIKKVIR